MILSDQAIRLNNIVTPCEERTSYRGLSYGLSCCGYDVRADVGVELAPNQNLYSTVVKVGAAYVPGVTLKPGQSVLMPLREHFDVPPGVVGFTKDKSTWVRQGLLCAAAVLEPGWRGFMALLLFNAGSEPLSIADGDPIAQVVFQWLDGVPERTYTGKYQGQGRGPQGPRFE